MQDHLEAALASIHGAPVKLTAAGRTDAGVHASSQVAHFDAVESRPLQAWVRGVNAHLPEGIKVLWSRAVGADFHARFSAEERLYRYFLLNRPVRPALLAGKVGWVHGRIDLESMNAAARYLLGVHDFSAFRAAECQAKTPVRDLREASITCSGQMLTLQFRADAFLHHQVRNMVGALVWVGLGRRAPEWLAEVLEGRDRTRGAATFMPDGLYLAGVRYAAQHGLPSYPPLVSAFRPDLS